METLTFTLKGRHGFFKKPEVNTYLYFTYGCIHKVALLGLFGAVMGFGGYEKQYRENRRKRGEKEEQNGTGGRAEEFPEFYRKLKDLSAAIIPGSKTGTFPKKIQVFNNSTGYASREAGGTLIVKEEWLENPSWDIYVLLEQEEAGLLAEKMIGGTCEYIPFLGKNDHPASILNPRILPAVRIGKAERLDSLAPEEAVRFEFSREDEEKTIYKYSEYLPSGLEKETNLYTLKKMTATNLSLKEASCDLYRCEDKILTFF